MRSIIREIVVRIQENKEIKSYFKQNVVIYNRMLKANLEDICSMYGEDNTLLITYNIVNNKYNLDLANTNNFNINIDVWSKNNLEETEEIAEKIIEELQEINSINIEKIQINTLDDDTYYRQNISIDFVKFN